jgi:hypothetical protein
MKAVKILRIILWAIAIFMAGMVTEELINNWNEHENPVRRQYFIEKNAKIKPVEPDTLKM